MSALAMNRPRTSAPGAAAEPLADTLRRFARTPKGWLTLLFVPLLLVGGSAVGWGLALPHVLSALAGVCLVDALVYRISRRAWYWPSSAVLSGLIVAFVLDPTTPLAVTFLVGAIASCSKPVLSTSRGHILNPAAFALAISVPLFATGQSWWGALPDLPAVWLLALIAGGAVIVDRLNKFPLVLSFAGSYFALTTLVALVNPVRVAELFRAPFLHAAIFLALFMLTDPPTSPGKVREQVWIGVLVGVASVVAQLAGIGQSYLLVGLLTGNVVLACVRWAGYLRARAALAED